MTDTTAVPLVDEPGQSDRQRAAQAEIEKQLWAIANTLRANSSMEPSEFKNYILGILFYKFLSEQYEDLLPNLLTSGEAYSEVWEEPELQEAILTDVGYIIKPQHLFSSMIAEINKGAAGNFDIATLQEALADLIRSTKGHDSEDDFDHLFDDLDLGSRKLGETAEERTRFMAKILQNIDALSFHHDDVEIDVLGNAYEYLISNFAATAGKKAGEFYTPQQVSKILAKIVAHGKPRLRNVYDPTCGSGSLLLRVQKELPEQARENIKFYGQELGTTTYNLARMNMMLHGVGYNSFDIRNGNTLTNDRFPGETYDAIVANPPYSAKWEPNAQAAADDRYNGYGKLPPASKADYAFVLHMLSKLEHDGTMAVVLPHGVLFRGAAEGTIRKALIDNNWLEAVIGLPANIFYGTSIPTCILVFKKNRATDKPVSIIDASREFVQGKNQNSLSDENVSHLIDVYSSEKVEEGYSTLVSKTAILANEYNLNLPRYIENNDQEEVVDIEKIQRDLYSLKEEEEAINVKIQNMIGQLHG